MRPLQATEILQIWEHGANLHPALALLPLLVAACPELPSEKFHQLTIGERDALLLTQREWMFGSQVEAVADCPNCEERLEISLTIDEIRATPTATDASNFGTLASYEIEAEGHQIAYRVPIVADAQTVNSLDQLLANCLVSVSKLDQESSPSDLPPKVIEAIGHEIALADPQADVQIALSCPDCHHEWLAVFDIVVFLWAEINTWAQRTLLEIHQLASAYGWNETEILALSPTRRQIYLQMIGIS